MDTLSRPACFDPVVDFLTLYAEIDSVFGWFDHQAPSGVQAYELVEALLFFTVELGLCAAFLLFLHLSWLLPVVAPVLIVGRSDSLKRTF